MLIAGGCVMMPPTPDLRVKSCTRLEEVLNGREIAKKLF
jgi:hypothetical protein